jgi:hypothetical protein
MITMQPKRLLFGAKTISIRVVAGLIIILSIEKINN